jgi:hypothetical protein
VKNATVGFWLVIAVTYVRLVEAFLAHLPF